MAAHGVGMDRLPVERRAVEAALSDGVIAGAVVTYSDRARIMEGVEERFAPGAFGDVSAADVTASVQHRSDRLIARTGSGLVLRDGSDALRAEIRSLDPFVVKQVEARVLRGLSAEFIVLDEGFDRSEGSVLREIRRARLLDVSVVARPAYAASVAEVEQRWLAERVRAAVGVRGLPEWAY